MAEWLEMYRRVCGVCVDCVCVEGVGEGRQRIESVKRFVYICKYIVYVHEHCQTSREMTERVGTESEV